MPQSVLPLNVPVAQQQVLLCSTGSCPVEDMHVLAEGHRRNVNVDVSTVCVSSAVLPFQLVVSSGVCA